MPTSCLRGNERECPFYFRPRELVLVEQFPKVVGVKSSLDDVQDMFPPGIRRAAARLSSFFATRVAQLNRARAMVGAPQVSGRPAEHYGEAGECSDAKSHRLPAQAQASLPSGLRQARQACRPLDSWVTSHVQTSPACSQAWPFRIVYMARGHPCDVGRARCVLNSAEIIDTLDAVGLVLSHWMEAGSLRNKQEPSADMEAACRDASDGMACVHMNLEQGTHTFLETVGIMQRASMIVGVQGSQNYNALFAPRSAILIEFVVFEPRRTVCLSETCGSAIPTNIFLGSSGLRTAILPIAGRAHSSEIPFAVDPCRLVRLIDQTGPLPNITSPLERCSEFRKHETSTALHLETSSACSQVQFCFTHQGSSRT